MSPNREDLGSQPESGGAHRGGKGLPWVLLGLGPVPFLVGAVVLAVVGNDFLPVQDIAQIELRTRDVGRYQVLHGPYSRDEWFHLGPAVFYLLAVPYWLTGGASVGMYLGALVINAGAVAGMALIARRRGGMALMVVTLLAAGLLVRSLGADFVRDPWNPSITVLPFGLMIFLAWAMTCRDLWALPVGVALASFLAQTHVGYAALALPLLAWGAAWLLVPAARDLWAAWRSGDAEGGRFGPVLHELRGGSRRVAWTLLASAGLLALLWAPPVLEQLTADGTGNLSAVVTYFRESGEPAHSLTDAWRVLSTQFDLTPDWLTGAASTPLSGEPPALYESLAIPVMLVPLGLAATYLWRRGGNDARGLLLTLAVAVLLGIVAVTRTTGIAFTYRLHWVQVLGMVTGVVMGWAGWLAVQPSLTLQTARKWVAGAAVAALVGVTAANAVSAGRAGKPLEQKSDTVSALVPDILAGLQADGDRVGDSVDGPVLVHGASFPALLYTTGLVLALERQGVDAGMLGPVAAAGEHRVVGPGAEPAATLIVAVNEDIPASLEDPELELVASRGTPGGVRPGDDPVTRAEAAFEANDVETMKALAREHLDDDLPDLFEVQAIAVFLQR